MPQEMKLPAPGANNFWYLNRQTESVIVFVHGIFSDSRDCWLHLNRSNPPESSYWPALIESDPRFKAVSVYMGGYYTAVDAGPYEVRNCADELFRAMNRIEEDGSPPVMSRERLLFVCHSTGGIVARYLLEYYVEQLRSKSIGLMLVASPSYGSKWADKLSLLSRFYNQSLGIQLRWGNWSLRDLDARFKDLVNNRAIPSLIGVEAYENKFIFHRKWLPDRSVVVTEESAGRYFGAPVLLRGTDHFSSVKPPNLKHPAHELLVDFWYRFGKLPSSNTVSIENQPAGDRNVSPPEEGTADNAFPPDEKLSVRTTDYSAGVRLLHVLSDVFVSYSDTPPSKVYEDYHTAEDNLKDWIFSNVIGADPRVITMMEDFIKQIRGYVALGNKMRDLWGGDGRPSKEMLHEFDRELLESIKKIVEQIRVAGGPP